MKAVFLKMVTGIAFNGGIKTFKYASLFMKWLEILPIEDISTLQ